MLNRFGIESGVFLFFFSGMKGGVKGSVLMSWFGTSLVPHSHQQRETQEGRRDGGWNEGNRQRVACHTAKSYVQAVLK